MTCVKCSWILKWRKGESEGLSTWMKMMKDNEFVERMKRWMKDERQYICEEMDKEKDERERKQDERWIPSIINKQRYLSARRNNAIHPSLLLQKKERREERIPQQSLPVICHSNYQTMPLFQQTLSSLHKLTHSPHNLTNLTTSISMSLPISHFPFPISTLTIHPPTSTSTHYAIMLYP